MGCPLLVHRVFCLYVPVCLVSSYHVIISQRAVKCRRRREENQ